MTHDRNNDDTPHAIHAAEFVLPCRELDDTLTFFTQRLGFRIEAVIPADDPTVVVISGHGARICLQRERSEAGTASAAGVLRLLCTDPAAIAEGATELTAPNGTRIELVEADPPLILPPLQQSFVLNRTGADPSWVVGRAGMRYRDLIPGRQGGRFAASHIQIPGGGPVPDYVHFHRVRFQMIYCYKGWVRVVYEDQGPPLVLKEGDCVLQPPEIRHRVLESSQGLEVIEISCPANHETRADHDLTLPTPELRPQREFAGQRFVHHVAAAAEWGPWRLAGFEARDTGIGTATRGVAGVRVVRVSGAPSPEQGATDSEFLFLFVLQGTVTLRRSGQDPEPMQAGDCCVVPALMQHGLADCASNLELLEVVLPAG